MKDLTVKQLIKKLQSMDQKKKVHVVLGVQEGKKITITGENGYASSSFFLLVSENACVDIEYDDVVDLIRL